MGQVTGTGRAVSGLGGAAGYGETRLLRSDDGSQRVNVSAVFERGFNLNGQRYGADSLYISTDGLVSFGGAAGGVKSSLSALTLPFIAPFHADVDTRLDGEGAESGPIWLDVDPVQDVVTITWQDVGFYRRNASKTNTFQLQIFDRGSEGLTIVLRYEDIDWTTGDLQGGWGGLAVRPRGSAGDWPRRVRPRLWPLRAMARPFWPCPRPRAIPGWRGFGFMTSPPSRC